MNKHKTNKRPYTTWLLVILWAGVSYLLGGLVGGLFYTLAPLLLSVEVPDSGTVRLLWNLGTGICAYGTIFATLYFGVKIIWKQPDVLATLGLRGRLTRQGLLLAVIGLLGYLAVSWILIQVIGVFVPGFDQLRHYDGVARMSVASEIIPGFIQIVILTPIIEEILFRGYLVGELKRRKMPVVMVIIVTSLIFGIMHSPPLSAAVDVAILGVVAAILRIRTGNIWASVAMHVLVNAIGFYSLYVAA